MKARLKSGKTINGKLAETFCRLGIAKEVKKRASKKAEAKEVENNNPVNKEDKKDEEVT